MNDIGGFTFYKSYYESLCDLEECDKQELLLSMLEFVFEDKEPNLKGFKKTIWTLIKPNLITSKNKSNNAKVKSNANQIEIKSKSNEINDLYDKDKDKERDIELDNNKKEIQKKKYFNDVELNKIFKEYLDVRVKLKLVNSERAINTLINKLKDYTDEIKIKMIEQSIVNSWKSIYELKGGQEEKVPEWFDKNIEAKLASEEEQKELQDIIDKF